jgi:hypothetical protein
MKSQILVICSDVYEYDNTCGILKDAFPENLGEIDVDWAKNAEKAINLLRQEKYQLLIIDLHIPKNQKMAVDEDAQNGIEVLKSIKKYSIPSLLVVPAWTRDLQEELNSLHRCRMVEKGIPYTEQLLKYSRMFLQAPSDGIDESTVEKTGFIDLTLDLHHDLWQFNISGEFGHSTYRDKGFLEIRSDKMSDLIHRSCNIQDIKDWKRELQQIGKALCEEIIENNRKFMKGFYRLTGKIDKLDKIRIRFSVDKDIHPVLLEALIEDDSIEEDPFLMLSSPVYRKLSVAGEYHLAFNQLGKDRPPVNCLIIESDFKGKIDKICPDTEFRRLNNINLEARWLKAFLEDNREAFDIGEVEWVRDTPQGGRLVDHLQEVLSRQRWELVHYAGHSLYKGKRGEGYLLFPHGKDADVVTLMEFSTWLRDCDTQLVFLSSCHSSEEGFVFELAANKIPSIIGFRWDIDDDKAFLCAQRFYTHLFMEGRTLEYAFLETRRDMHRKHPKNRVWAAPMLIMQEK